MSKQNLLLPTATFCAIAFGLSFAFNQLPPFTIFAVNGKDVLCGFGPLIGGLVCYVLFKTPASVSVWGKAPIRVAIGVAAVMATFLFTQNTGDFSAGLVILVTQLLYCFGEEFGWRHYLHSQTNTLNRWLQPLLIGCIWFAWHYAWLPEPVKAMLGEQVQAPAAVGMLLACLSLVLFSMFLGWAVQSTGSVLIPTVLHFAIKTNQPTLLAAVGLSLLLIFTLRNKHQHPQPASPQNAAARRKPVITDQP